jgi:hypothetical protein
VACRAQTAQPFLWNVASHLKRRNVKEKRLMD